MDLFVSCMADSIDPPCLSESQLAQTYLLEGLGWNIASCWHGFSLGSICFLWMFSLFLLSNWMFPSAPAPGCYPVAVPQRTCSAGACLHEDVSRCSGGTAPEPLASFARMESLLVQTCGCPTGLHCLAVHDDAVHRGSGSRYAGNCLCA